ncbi:ABC transporter ATP-binding protein [Candidatus Chloroploca asiatica]|uniref:ABC transporter n=1 Tax=Candidatus Chloroploca asiatica TaxID=1506545 RepID=A0A2H3KPV1_9CHLR|nr:ATP-binding cassette domain-containing protein [Candidatus Chloroploca asiatica]PDV99486.1 ABC transporter [Candidatus Chloroploca asiatica]
MEIAVTNLTKTFGSLRANDGLSLRFASGKIHGVLGENGAGKSTLMKLVSGFLQPDAGQLAFDGQPVRLRGPGDALQAGVGMVHQDPLDVPGFTALENLLCAAPRRAFPSRAMARTTLTTMAQRLGFTLAPDTPVGAMTVGQRQQLEIVRLLACGARTLILDEPTTGITAAQAHALFDALRQLAADGNTVLFVSHKLDEVAALCDTVSVLRTGQLVGEQLPMPQPQQRLLELMFGERIVQASGQALLLAGVSVSEPQGLPVVQPIQDERSSEASPTRPLVWQLEQVTAREGMVRLRNVDLRIPQGRVIGLAGLDGSGQQILLRLLAGRLHPDSGRILINGVDMTRARTRTYREAGIEYLPADRMRDGIVGALSLTDHFALLQPAGITVDRQVAAQAAREAIAAYEIKATPITPLIALSGGNQQRAMLALVPDACRGLACEQPTRGLDVASAQGIWQRLQARCATGCSVVFASADLDELMAYSDEILVFFAGEMSAPLPRATLTGARLAELIGGVGFERSAS